MAKVNKKICQNCQRLFQARRDAKTCSAACRKALQRARVFIAKEAEALEDSGKQAWESFEQTFAQPFVAVPALAGATVGSETEAEADTDTGITVQTADTEPYQVPVRLAAPAATPVALADTAAGAAGLPLPAVPGAPSLLGERLTLQTPRAVPPPPSTQRGSLRRRRLANLVRLSPLTLAGLAVLTVGVGATLFGLFGGHQGTGRQQAAVTPLGIGQAYATSAVPLPDGSLGRAGQLLGMATGQEVAINGLLRVNGGLVLTPGGQPGAPSVGQVYLDTATGGAAATNAQVRYFNGSRFMTLATVESVQQTISSLGLGGLARVNGVGQGLAVSGGTLSNTGVTSLTGVPGELEVSGPAGAINLSIGQAICRKQSLECGFLPGTTLAFVQDGNSFGELTTLGSNDAYDLALETNGVERMRVTIGGNVGINTTAPAYLLDVAGDVNTTTMYRVNGIQLSSGHLSDSSNLAKLDGNQTFTGSNSFTNPANSFTGNGAGLTNLNADNITTGILDIARGGTNSQALPIAGGLVYGNGSGYSVTSFGAANQIAVSGGMGSPSFQNLANLLTAGSNIAITGTTQPTISVASSPVFSGQVSIQGADSLALGTNSNVGSILFRDGATANVGRLQLAGALSGNVTYVLPVASGAQEICTFQAGNCAGSGSTISGTGTTNQLAKFTGSQVIGNSNISDDGSTVTISSGAAIQGAAGLSLGVGTTTNGQLVFYNSATGNSLTLQSGTTTPGNLVLTLPTADGLNGNCLKTNGSGQLAFAACTGGPGGGVSSVNVLTGDVEIVSTTTDQIIVGQAGQQITLSLPQDIAVTSAVTFGGLTVNGGATVNGTLAATTLTQSGNFVCDVSNNCSYAPTSGSANYIHNGTTPQTADFNITGSGVIGSSLQVQGTLRVDTLGGASTTALCRDGSNLITTCSTTGSGAAFVQGGNSFGATAVLGTNDNNSLQLRTNGATAMTILANGNVGIGTTSPSSLLEVAGGTLTVSRPSTPSQSVSLYHNGNGVVESNTSLQLRAGASSIISFFQGSSEPIRILGNGNVGIGTTSPATKLQVGDSTGGNFRVSGGNQGYTDLIYNGDSRVQQVENGNATWGAGYLATGGIRLGQNAANGYAYMQGYGGNLLFNPVAGNVGIGTTTPQAKLHVEGQCVTGDTRLRRRRKRKDGTLSDEWEEVRIDQIEAGDHIMSLDQTSGRFVSRQVKGLMDMGTQEVFRLQTVSGKTIETTAEHPYLVNVEAENQIPAFAFIDESGVARDSSQPLFSVGAFVPSHNVFEMNQALRRVYMDAIVELQQVEERFEFKFKYITKNSLPFYLRIIEILKDHQDDWHFDYHTEQSKQKDFWKQYLSMVRQLLMYTHTFKFSVLADYLNKPKSSQQTLETLETSRRTINLALQIESQGSVFMQVADILLGAVLFTEYGKQDQYKGEVAAEVAKLFGANKKAGIDPIYAARGEDDPWSNLRNFSIAKTSDLSSNSTYKAVWRKVSHLKPGMLIATVDGWEHITAITPTGRKRTYDIEVQGTHNFVGNGIVAHNTYLNGNVGIGTASPTYRLDTGVANVAARLGNALVGDWPSLAGYAGFGHQALNGGSNSYALLQDSNGQTFLNAASGQDIRFRNNNNDLAIIKSSGNVGIGTTAPGSLLQLGSDAGTAASGITLGSLGDVAIYRSASNELTLSRDVAIGTGATNSTLRLRSSGDFNIASAPAAGFRTLVSMGNRSWAFLANGSGRLSVESSNPATQPFFIRGASGQTADLQQFQDNNGNVIASFNATGQLNLGRASNTVGQINFFGSGSANSIALQGPAAPGSGLTLTLPNESGTLCSTGSVCSGYAAASGSGNYIQNGTSPQTANFNITGNGTVGNQLNVANGANVTRYLIVTGTVGINTELLVISSGGKTVPSAIIRAGGGQTTDLLQLQDSAGAVLSRFDANGRLGIGTAGAPATLLQVAAASPVTTTQFLQYTNTTNNRSIGLFSTELGVLGLGVTAGRMQLVGAAASGGIQLLPNNGAQLGISELGAQNIQLVAGGTGGILTLQQAAQQQVRILGRTTIDLSGESSGLSLTNPNLIVKQAVGQTADMLQLQNSAGTVLTKFDATGNLTVGTASSTAGITAFGTIVARPASVGTRALQVVLPSESFERFRVMGDGAIAWGPGTGGVDTTLYRSAASTLKTDGTLVVGGTGSATPNIQAAAAGVYLGSNSGTYRIELANGTSNWAIDNNSGSFRIFQPGVASRFGINSSGALDIGGAGDTNLYRSAANTLKTDGNLIVAGTLSSPGAGANSEHFGAGSTAAGGSSLAVGNTAVAGGSNAVALGASSTANGSNSIAIGNLANTGSNVNSIALGRSAATNADNQLVIGSASAAISSAFIGNGVTTAAPVGFTLQGTGGSGTNIAGASVALAGGRGTGSAAGGNLNFQVALPGSSGAGLNALQTACTISGTNGSFSCPGAGTGSERFGAGSSVGSTNDSTALGASATITGNSAVAVGKSSSAVGSGVAIGRTAVAGGLNDIVIGQGANSSNVGNATIIGYTASSTASSSITIGNAAQTTCSNSCIAIGSQSSAAFGGSIALGREATTTAANQLVIGGASSFDNIQSVVIGNGVTAATPVGFTLQGTGSTTDGTAGANVTVQGGAGTVGNSNGGNLLLNGGTKAGTGTVGHVILQGSNSGNVGIGTASPATKLQVGDSTGGNFRVSGGNQGYTDLIYNGDSRVQQVENGNATWGAGYLATGGIRLGQNAANGYAYMQGYGGNLLFNPVAGNVGIGTTGPGARLQINASASGIGQIIRANATTPGDLLQLQDAAGAVLSRFDANGNLGIGINPSYAIDVSTPGGGIRLNRTTGSPAFIYLTSGGAGGGQLRSRDVVSGGGLTFATGTGVQVGYFDTSGQFVFANSATPGGTALGKVSVYSDSIGQIGLAIRGFSGQTADLLQLQDSTGAVLSRFDASGQLGIGVAPVAGGGAIQLAAGLTAANGINFGGTANLYRGGAGVLLSDATIRAGSLQTTDAKVTFGPSSTFPTLQATGSSLTLQSNGTNNTSFIVKANGTQTADLLQIRDASNVILTAFQADGKLVFGPSGSQDTNLYRSAADTLRTDDSFIVGADLNVSGASTLTTLTVTGAATFQSTLTVTGTATFNGNIIINGKITGNTNTRGQATITAGNTTATYTFPNASLYTTPPNVVITPTSNPGTHYWVSNVTTTSFDLNLATTQPGDITFNFQAQE